MASEKSHPPALVAAVGRWLSRLGTALYRYHYGLGVHALRLFHRLGRDLYRRSAPLRRVVRYVWLRLAVRPAHRFFRRLRRLGSRFPLAFQELGAAAKKNVFSVIPCFFRLCGRAVRYHWDELTALGRLLGPVTAGVVLAVTIAIWTQTDFCLSLSYHGQDLGVIENAAIYDEGAALAKERVINADNSFSVEAVPVFSMTVQGSRTALSDTEVCDAILRTAGDSIAEATGLYVDGDFIGAMVSQDDLQAVLDRFKEGYYDKDDPDQRAEFIQAVTMEEGLYPISTVKGEGAMRDRLSAQTVVERIYTVAAGDTLSTIARKHDLTTAELRSLNPAYADTDKVNIGDKLTVQRAQTFLRVKMIKTIRYTEEIDYNTQTVYRDDKPVTYSKVTTKGQEGSQDVVAEITYIDGVETGRAVISKTVTKQPVTKVVERGTQKVVSSSGSVVEQGDGVTTGSMTWPVPVCHNVYQGYHRGHLAIDISSGPIPVNGKPAVAADGGTVIYAGWYYGYGNYVKIQHANGLVTTYAHLKSIKVVKGQLVTRGQTIGLVGNTGNSDGPHLHFEVIKNGVKVNPLNYVKP